MVHRDEQVDPALPVHPAAHLLEQAGAPQCLVGDDEDAAHRAPFGIDSGCLRGYARASALPVCSHRRWRGSKGPASDAGHDGHRRVPRPWRTLGGSRAFVAGAVLAAVGGQLGDPDGRRAPGRGGRSLTRFVFRATRSGFDVWTKKADTYEERDRRMARYAPVSLLLLPLVWMALVIVGFTGMFWGLGVDPVRRAFYESGSSLLTLGFVAPSDLPDAHRHVRRGGARARPRRPPDQLPADDLRVVPAARAARRPTGDPRRRPAVAGADDRPPQPARRGWTPSTRSGTTGRPGSPTSRRPTPRSRRSSSSARSATNGPG